MDSLIYTILLIGTCMVTKLYGQSSYFRGLMRAKFQKKIWDGDNVLCDGIIEHIKESHENI